MKSPLGSYDSYRRARDESWRALLAMENAALPVDPEALARIWNIGIFTRKEAEAYPRLARLLEKAPAGVCVSIRIDRRWHIFLRDGLDEARRRFAVAHELGHIRLDCPVRPLGPGIQVFRSVPATGDLMDGTEGTPDCDADIFAIRLLAPACLLHELRVDTPGGISALCGLPPRAAAFRAERMALLNERNAFYTHALERRVRDRYLPEIRRRLSLPGTPIPARVIPAPLPRRTESPIPEKRGFPWLAAALGFAAAAGGTAAYFLLR